MTPQSTVRVAEAADEDDLLTMCRLLHGESGIRDQNGMPFPFSVEKTRSRIQRLVIPRRNAPDPEVGVCGIIGEPGALEASICLGVAAPWYSDQEYLYEIWNWVHPDFRKGTAHAKSLIAFSKKVSDFMRATLMMGIMSTNRVEAKERFYARAIGVEKFGGFFLYQPTDGRA